MNRIPQPTWPARDETATLQHRERFELILDSLDRVALDMYHLEVRFSTASALPDIPPDIPNPTFRAITSFLSVQWHYADTLAKCYQAYFVKANLYNENPELRAMLEVAFRQVSAFLSFNSADSASLSIASLVENISGVTKDFPDNMEDMSTAISQLLINTLVLEDKTTTYRQFRE